MLHRSELWNDVIDFVRIHIFSLYLCNTKSFILASSVQLIFREIILQTAKANVDRILNMKFWNLRKKKKRSSGKLSAYSDLQNRVAAGFILCFRGLGLFLNKQKTTHLRFGRNGWFGVFVVKNALLATFLLDLHFQLSRKDVAPNGYTAGSTGGTGVER